jgi:hypothetical protein
MDFPIALKLAKNAKISSDGALNMTPKKGLLA